MKKIEKLELVQIPVYGFDKQLMYYRSDTPASKDVFNKVNELIDNHNKVVEALLKKDKT